MLVEVLATITHSPLLLAISFIGYIFLAIKLYKWAYNSNVVTYNHGGK